MLPAAEMERSFPPPGAANEECKCVSGFLDSMPYQSGYSCNRRTTGKNDGGKYDTQFERAGIAKVLDLNQNLDGRSVRLRRLDRDRPGGGSSAFSLSTVSTPGDSKRSVHGLFFALVRPQRLCLRDAAGLDDAARNRYAAARARIPL